MKRAKSTIKGRITAPIKRSSRFAKYRGIGNKGIGSGRTAVNRWLRGLRGEATEAT